MLGPNKRYAVFSLNQDEKRNITIWTRAGNAYVNKDGSMNLYLDVLPIAGRLHVREAGERAETSAERTSPAPSPMESGSVLDGGGYLDAGAVQQ